MTHQLPRISQNVPHTDISDPRMSELLRHLKPFDPQEVLEKVGLASKNAEAAGAADLTNAVAIPKITQIEHDSARFEIREINGHLVYYVELRRPIDPLKFLEEVVKPAFGPLWGSRETEIEGWLDSEATTKCGPVIGIWLKDFRLDAMNRNYFIERIPRDIAQRITSATTPK